MNSVIPSNQWTNTISVSLMSCDLQWWLRYKGWQGFLPQFGLHFIITGEKEQNLLKQYTGIYYSYLHHACFHHHHHHLHRLNLSSKSVWLGHADRDGRQRRAGRCMPRNYHSHTHTHTHTCAHTHTKQGSPVPKKAAIIISKRLSQRCGSASI